MERQAQNLVNRLEGKPPMKVEGDSEAPAESADESPADAGSEFDLSDDKKIGLAYNYVYARHPTDAEIRLGRTFLDESREASPDDARTPWVQYARVLFGANEFRFID